MKKNVAAIRKAGRTEGLISASMIFSIVLCPTFFSSFESWTFQKRIHSLIGGELKRRTGTLIGRGGQLRPIGAVERPTENIVGDFLPTLLTDYEMRSIWKFFVIGEGVCSLILGIFA
jgi:hypothetical protein